jgi:anti-sigma B factor antagonist
MSKTTGDSTETVITIDGEFDITEMEPFRARVSAALKKLPRSLAINASGLTFLDSSGLRSLLLARAAADQAGVAFRISQPSAALRRLVERTGLQVLLLDG